MYGRGESQMWTFEPRSAKLERVSMPDKKIKEVENTSQESSRDTKWKELEIRNIVAIVRFKHAVTNYAGFTPTSEGIQEWIST